MDRLADPAVFAATVLGIEVHRGQLAYLRDSHPTKVLVGGRRSGKTFAIAIETLFHAAVALRDRKPVRQLLVAPAIDQARLLIATVSRLLKASPLGGAIEGEVTSPFPELRLPFGGLIFVRAAHEEGKYLRGHSAARVVVDEAAYVPDKVITEAITPILADSNGALVLASTPASKGALFHKLFEQGQGTDARVRSFIMRSAENPHISASYVEAQRAVLTSRQFQVEYEGSFMDGRDALFPWAQLTACAVGTEAPPQEGRRYVLGWDPAQRRDRSGVAVLDTTEKPWRLVQVLDLHGQDYGAQVQRVAALSRAYGNAEVIVDQTGLGQVLLDLLRRESCAVRGVIFTAATKTDLVTNLALLIERRELVFPPHRDLLDELRFFEARATGQGRVQYGAPEGGQVSDDLVMALALAVHGAGGVTGGFAFEGLYPLGGFERDRTAGIAGRVAGRDYFIARDGSEPDESTWIDSFPSWARR